MTEGIKRRKQPRVSHAGAIPSPREHVAPDWLNPAAKDVYDALVRDLKDRGTLAMTDDHALIRYCDAWVRWLAAAKFLDQHGDSYPVKDSQGNLRCFMPFPAAHQYHQLAAMLLKLEQELGLTPSARSRINAEHPPVPRLSEAGRRFFLGPG